MNQLRTHRGRALAVLAVVVLLLAACGSNTDETATSSGASGDSASAQDRSAGTEGTIKIGAILDFTGPFAAASPSFREGLEAWRDHVNASGGIGGRDVELLYEDGQADPNAAATAATKLISQDDVFAIACVLGSAALAAAEVAAEQGALMLPCAYSDQLFDPVQPNVFVAATPYADQLARGVEAMVDETGAETAAIVRSSDEFGDSGEGGARAAFDAAGVEEVANESFDRGAEDLQAQAQTVVRTEADLVVCVCVYSQTGLLAQALDRADAGDLPVVAPNPTVGPPFFEIAGDVGGSVYAADYVAHPGTEGWDPAAEAMQTAVGRDPNSFELLGLLNLALLTEAMGAVDGEITTSSVREVLEGMTDATVPGLAAPVTFSADRHHASDQSAVYRAEPNGQTWEPVAEVAAPAGG